MRHLPRPRQCAAIIGTAVSCKIEKYQRCQNDGLALIDGVLLCGTHVNAIADDSLLVLREHHRGPDE